VVHPAELAACCDWIGKPAHCGESAPNRSSKACCSVSGTTDSRQGIRCPSCCVIVGESIDSVLYPGFMGRLSWPRLKYSKRQRRPSRLLQNA